MLTNTVRESILEVQNHRKFAVLSMLLFIENYETF